MPSLRWYVNRLRVMPKAEVLYRAKVWAILKWEKEQWKRGTSPYAQQDLAYYLSPDWRPPLGPSPESLPQALWESFRFEERPLFFFQKIEQAAFKEKFLLRFPEHLPALRKQADRLCDHEIKLWHRTFSLGPEVNWHQDPLTQREWPKEYWNDIDYRDGQKIGGVKWVWEINRQLYLTTLGKAYFLTGEERYAQAACDLIAQWIVANPPLSGVNWISPLELAIRLISWTWTLHFIRTSEALNPELLALILRSIAQQTRFIAAHRSAYTSANNHLIGEAAALAVIGLMFPCLDGAKQWREQGVKILGEELQKQIYPDGVTAEQSLHYQTFVLDFWWLVMLLESRNGRNLGELWRERLEAATEFLLTVMDETGQVPALGDSDDGQAFLLCEQPDFNPYRSLLNTAAVVWSRGDFKAGGEPFDEKTFWLTGLEGEELYHRLPATSKPRSSRAFPRGGYYVLRDEKALLTFDCGPLGYLSTAVHGHADALSVTLRIGSQSLLVDAGTYCYHENPKWRNYFRSSAAHNTVVVDGHSQSEIGGLFLWTRKAEASGGKWISQGKYEYVEGEHDGYQTRGVKHRRRVYWVPPRLWMITDWLTGTGSHQIEQIWHFPPRTQVTCQEKGMATVVTPQVIMWVWPQASPSPIAEVCEGQTNPIQGWTSRAYGLKEPSPVLIYRATTFLPWQITTVFAVLEQSEEAVEFRRKVEILVHEIIHEAEKGTA